MTDKLNIDLDDSFLKKFFGLTDQLVPDMEDITLPILKRQLLNVEGFINDLKDALQMDPRKPMAKAQRVRELLGGDAETSSDSRSSRSSISSSSSSTSKSSSKKHAQVEVGPKGRILIIDDLGVITYQLSTMLKRLNFDCVTSNDIVGAIELFKKSHYDFVLMDLFIPTQREGFILLDELKKMSANKPYKTVIGIMSASNKKEYKMACSQKGSDFYVEKTESWQDDVCRLIDNYES